MDGYELLSVKTVDNRGFNLPAVEAQSADGTEMGNDVTADVAVRRAVNMGIDRQEMIENVLGGIRHTGIQRVRQAALVQSGFRGGA